MPWPREADEEAAAVVVHVRVEWAAADAAVAASTAALVRWLEAGTSEAEAVDHEIFRDQRPKMRVDVFPTKLLEAVKLIDRTVPSLRPLSG